LLGDRADGIHRAPFEQAEIGPDLFRAVCGVILGWCQSTAIADIADRWLLRARDLSESDTLPFTQEFLANMVGVNRTSVSPVAHMVQKPE